VTDRSFHAGPPDRTVTVFDTTLRDGEQAPGNGMSAAGKRDTAIQLEALGVDVVEVGFPASSANEFLAAKMVRQALTSTTVATFARCTEADIAKAVEAVGVTRHQVQLLATASELHLTHKRGISRHDCFREIATAVRFAASLGVTNISVGLEDASRGTHDLLRALVDCSIEAGATTIVVADTSGCQLPAEYGDLVSAARSWIPGDVTLSVHCHDDMGLALANALAGIQAGADQVQTTLGGVGERSGNTALEELAAALAYKGEQLGVRARIDTKGLYQAYLTLKSSMGLLDARNKAIFGTNAFATSAGIHQDGLLQEPKTYEYLDPAMFGRERQLLVGRHSGRAVLRYILDQQHLDVTEAQLNVLYEELIGNRIDHNVETLDEFGKRVRSSLARASGGALPNQMT
jgi:2-isopropylmalate synthase